MKRNRPEREGGVRTWGKCSRLSARESSDGLELDLEVLEMNGHLVSFHLGCVAEWGGDAQQYWGWEKSVSIFAPFAKCGTDE